MNNLTQFFLSHNEPSPPHTHTSDFTHAASHACQVSFSRSHMRLHMRGHIGGVFFSPHVQVVTHFFCTLEFDDFWMLMSCCGVYPGRTVDVAGSPAFNDVYLARV